jgi:hypothetical protein
VTARRTRLGWRGLWAVLLTALASAATPQEDERLLIVKVRVERISVFDDETAEDRRLARWVNALHSTTRESTIRREMWFGEGDRVTSEEVEEFERNLRDIGLFAEAEVKLEPTDVPGEYELVIHTHDRLSLFGGAAGGVIGGVGVVGGGLGERNLFGRGDRLSAAYAENSLGEFRGAVSYRDFHVGSSWVQGNITVGRTDEGNFIRAGLRRPFKHLADPWSWKVNIDRSTSDTDYYEAGESVAEVDQAQSVLNFESIWRTGPLDRLWHRGFVLSYGSFKYDPATGAQANTVRVPGDTDRIFSGGLLGYDRVSEYRKVRGLDTLDYVQDLTLGQRYEIIGGGQWRAEAGESERVEPSLSLKASTAHYAGRESYVTLGLRGSGRTHAGEWRGWTGGVALHGYLLERGPHTYAGSVAFDAAFEGDDLPISLTLGEDNGLRGYPAREFSGTRRMRINLEDRLDFGITTYAFQLGMVGFYDAGWSWDQGESPGEALQSVGVGLRIGSRSLLGGGVVRIDLAFPLNSVDGREDYGPQLSLSIGQVFSFVGNSSSLSQR